MIDAALRLARQGMAVFPIRAASKAPPLVRAWPETATVDESQARDWWTRWPGANVGIATGASGLLVVDLDGQDGQRGWDALCVGQRVPVTREATTPHEGRHIYYRRPDGLDLGNSASRLAPGIDTRGIGGYVVAPPSIADARAYRWVDPWAPIAPLPSWVAELLQAEPQNDRGPDPKTGTKADRRRADVDPTVSQDRMAVYARAQLADRCQRLATTAPGERNVRLYGAAKDAGRWIAAGALDAATVEAELWAAAEASGLKAGETKRSMASGLADGMKERPEDDSGWDPTGPARLTRHRSGARSTTAPDAGADGEPVDSLWTPTRPWTDLGNAERLIDAYGQDLHHCEGLGGWLVWDGRRWMADHLGLAQQRAKATARAIQDEADAVDNDGDEDAHKYAESLRKFGRQTEASGRLSAMLQVAETEPGIRIVHDQLDADPWGMTVGNGLVDLRTAELRPHERQALATKMAPVDYDPDARADRWRAFLLEIMSGDVEMVDYLQRAVGYTLTGSCREQCMFLLHGGGENGKSTLISLLEALLGDYVTVANSDVLMASRSPGKSGPTPEIAMLRGARMVSSMEVREGRRMEEGLIKQLTGEDSITADMKYRNPITFRPRFKIWLACNHLPRIVLQDHGTWRRIQVIRFRETFTADDPRRDNELPAKLRAELPGILAWAVEGCALWQAKGLQPPTCVSAATEEYRNDQDLLSLWLEECCDLAPDALANNQDVWDSWRSWAEKAGEAPGSKRTLTRYLRERGYKQEVKWVGGRSQRVWLGIRSWQEDRTETAARRDHLRVAAPVDDDGGQQSWEV